MEMRVARLDKNQEDEGVGLMTKRELIDMFKNKIFPKQAEDLLKINYEGLGELDKREYLRDTSILIMLAEKGLKTEQDIVNPYLEKLRADIEKKHTKAKQRVSVLQMNAYTDCLQMIDNLLSESEGEE